MRYGMVIDLKRCIGCQACTLACKQTNATAPGVFWTKVLISETGHFPYSKARFQPILCMHCNEPACVEVCRDATNKLIVPLKYGTVCYWQHQDRFSHSWTTLPAHDHLQEQHECQTNVLCITEQLLDDFKNFKLVLRAKVKDSCGRKFYTNEVLIKVF